MKTTKVSFEFPEDAWPGIVESLTEHNWPATVPNPEYDGTDLSIPQKIENPTTREQAAIGVIKQFVEQRFIDWATRSRLAPLEIQVQNAVTARAREVSDSTTATVE